MKKTINNSFRNAKPEAAILWNQELNGDMTPDNTSKMSTKKVYFNCSRGKHDPYPIRVCDIRVPPYMCPECMKDDEEENYRKYSLKLNVPKAEEMWDKDKNAIPLEEAKTYMSETAHFICDEGHNFPRTIRSFVKNQNCPVCSLDSVAKYPHLVRQWDFKKNKDHDINLTSANSKDEVYWRCKKCGYGWKTQIFTRKKSKGRCPCCEERTVIVKGITDLFTLVPGLEESYDYDANVGIDPYTLSVTSNTPIHWKCPDCGNHWVSAPLSRVEKNGDSYRARKCPACAGVMRTKSYGEEYPELVSKFADDVNECTLYDIILHNDAKETYFWNCDQCGEEFPATVIAMVRALNTASHGCPYCSGKKVLRENSFAARHPEVMDEYDPRNEIDPYTVTEGSSKSGKWICRNDSTHRWTASFHSRAMGLGFCKICRDFYHGRTMFYEQYPELEARYDKTKNERPFHMLTLKSNDNVWWTCAKGHSFPQQVCHVADYGKVSCPYCENRLLLKGFNDLAKQRPDLLAFYDYEKNTKKPDELLINSWDESTWWKCEEGHSFQCSVVRMTETTACPICTRKLVVRGINDADSAFPDLKFIWDYEKNTVMPYEISDCNRGMYYFKCEKGHSYQTRLETVVNHNFECLVCDGSIIQPGVNSLADSDSDLCLEISPNEERRPETLHKSMAISILWKCVDCGADYHYPVNERSIGDDSCPFCNGRYTKLGVNSLIDTDPDLAKEFSPNNDCSAERVNKNSDAFVRWICPTCTGEYWARLSEREVGDDSCPYCSGRLPLAGYNTLETVIEDIDDVWDDSNDRSYTEMLPTYTYYKNWKCQTCGGVYSKRILEYIEARKNGEEPCPYCADRLPLAGLNTLETVIHDIDEVWDISNEKHYTSVLATSSDYASFKCKTCGGVYRKRISEYIEARKNGEETCSYCTGKLPLAGFNTLAKKNPKYMSEWSYINNYILCDPDEILPTYNELVWWKCEKCNQLYQMSPKDRENFELRHKIACPYCKGRRQKKRYYV